MISKFTQEIQYILAIHNLHSLRLCNPYYFVANNTNKSIFPPKIIQHNPKYKSHSWAHCFILLIGILLMIVRIGTDSKTVFETSVGYLAVTIFTVVALHTYLHRKNSENFSRLINQLMVFERRHLTSSDTTQYFCHETRTTIWIIRLTLIFAALDIFGLSFTGVVFEAPWDPVPPILSNFLKSLWTGKFNAEWDQSLGVIYKTTGWIVGFVFNNALWVSSMDIGLTNATLQLVIATFSIYCSLVNCTMYVL